MALQIVPNSKTQVSINEEVTLYNNLRADKKVIEGKMKELADSIKTYASNNGSKDSKGSYYCENDKFTFGSVAKKTVSFNDKAISILKKKGLHEAIVVTEMIDKDAVSKLVDNGELSYADMEEMTSVSVVYSVDIKVKEELPEVEVKKVNLPISASRKPKLSVKGKRK